MTYDPHGRRGVVDRGSCASVAAPVAIAYGTGLLGDDGAADTAPADDGVAPTVRYGEELRANWDVTGVADDDVLNVRDLPGVEGAIIGMLAHDAAELESTGRIAKSASSCGARSWSPVTGSGGSPPGTSPRPADEGDAERRGATGPTPRRGAS